jgi:hypothetical protein
MSDKPEKSMSDWMSEAVATREAMWRQGRSLLDCGDGTEAMLDDGSEDLRMCLRLAQMAPTLRCVRPLVTRLGPEALDAMLAVNDADDRRTLVMEALLGVRAFDDTVVVPDGPAKDPPNIGRRFLPPYIFRNMTKWAEAFLEDVAESRHIFKLRWVGMANSAIDRMCDEDSVSDDLYRSWLPRVDEWLEASGRVVETLDDFRRAVSAVRERCEKELQ